MEDTPFPDLKIYPTDFLESLSCRSKCPKCRKSRKYYCYTCYVPVAEIADSIPRVKLPIKVDIIKHPSECDGKSTAVHAGVICPEDVTILTYPCIPDYCKEKTVLVFPGEHSITLEDLAKTLGIQQHYRERPAGSVRKKSENSKNIQTSGVVNQLNSDHTALGDDSHLKTFEIRNKGETSRKSEDAVQQMSEDSGEDSESSSKLETQKYAEDQNADKPSDEIVNNNENGQRTVTVLKQDDYIAPFDRVVFIDSTWNQTKSIYNDERLKGLRCLELKTRRTKFWRHQEDVPDTYLSTVEAVYYFMRDFHEIFIGTSYSGEYDNLLFFFMFMYGKIRKIYDGGEELRAYKKRKVTPS